jgi:hypothetical protein
MSVGEDAQFGWLRAGVSVFEPMEKAEVTPSVWSLKCYCWSGGAIAAQWGFECAGVCAVFVSNAVLHYDHGPSPPYTRSLIQWCVVREQKVRTNLVAW